ncbi:hypothetical protein C0J52_24204 [Blattella germanica]|nr:hypothetical protein C0J52_24204 [Blattella germanica]
MPYPGDSGFTQWHEAMKMVARLPGGIPPEFRRRLWLTLAEKHLQERGVDWNHAERFCFNEWSNPDDDELGVQIVKDLHRTGCSLFCGAAAEENQALLKRVLLAYARWNKAVGYCQGFNMLAALILQVMDRSETDSVKVMIYLIEGVLPESYFANNLRGLSVDMAVFRDLLRLRLPTLSRHLDHLQHDARDSATGTSYEPPLTNVFTMQWFLTLFSNCLPQSTVLRVWDLIFLEGNEVLLRTALAIWDGLADRIMAVDSADEFYSIMGVLTREMLEFGLMDTNNLIKTIVTIAPFPFPELPELRDKYLYNITPWTHTVSTAARRGLKLFHSDDDEEDGTDEDDEKIAVAATYGISAVFRSSRRRDSMNRAPSPSSSLSAINFTPPASDRDRLVPVLDISALKQQYVKLRERQRQAHIILTAACARQPLGPSAPNPVAMNHLLLGKTALLSVRGAGPPAGAVPPPRSAALKAAPKSQRGRQQQGQLTVKSNVEAMKQRQQQQEGEKSGGETLHWKDAARKKLRRGSQQETSIPVQDVDTEPIPTSGTGVPEIKEPEEDESECDEPDHSEDSNSSTSTELCDEPDRLSDFDSEEPTSISDASSYAPSATEQIAMKIPSPIKSGVPTPETISPMKEDSLPVKEQPTSREVVEALQKDLEDKSPRTDIMEQLPIEQVPVLSPLKEVLEQTSSREVLEQTSQEEVQVEINATETEETDMLSRVQYTVLSNIPDAKLEFDKSVQQQQSSLEGRSEIEDTSLKSPTKQEIDELEGVAIVDKKEDFLSDRLILKLPSPLKEKIVLKEKEMNLILKEAVSSTPPYQIVSPVSPRRSISPISSIKSVSPTSPKRCISPVSQRRTISPVSPTRSISPFSARSMSPVSPKRIISPVNPMGSISEAEAEECKLSLKEEFELAAQKSPISTDIKLTGESVLAEITVLDMVKKERYPSEHIEKLESEESFKETVKHLPLSETYTFVEEAEETKTKDQSQSDISSSISTQSVKGSTSLLDRTQQHVDAMFNGKPEQRLKEISPRISPVNEEISITDILKTNNMSISEKLKTDNEIQVVAVDISVPDIEVTCVTDEVISGEILGSENFSELNQTLQEHVQKADGDETYKIEEKSEIDYAEMTDLLGLDEDPSLGRRNSERALKIIQENSEILQRIMQCQARRPSKLSEEESNGGTATVPSEVSSVPTPTSIDNIDVAPGPTKEDTSGFEKSESPKHSSISATDIVNPIIMSVSSKDFNLELEPIGAKDVVSLQSESFSPKAIIESPQSSCVSSKDIASSKSRSASPIEFISPEARCISPIDMTSARDMTNLKHRSVTPETDVSAKSRSVSPSGKASPESRPVGSMDLISLKPRSVTPKFDVSSKSRSVSPSDKTSPEARSVSPIPRSVTPKDFTSPKSRNISPVDVVSPLTKSVSPKIMISPEPKILSPKDIPSLQSINVSLKDTDMDRSPTISSIQPTLQSQSEQKDEKSKSYKQKSDSITDVVSKSWIGDEAKEEISSTESRPYSFSFISEDSITSFKSDEKQVSNLTSTKSFTLSPEAPTRQNHRYSLDFGKSALDSKDTKLRISSDDKFSSYFEDKVRFSSQLDEDYKESKAHKFEPEKERYSTVLTSGRKRYKTLDSGLDESITSQFPKRYSPDYTIHSSYSSNLRSARSGLDFFDKPLISNTETSHKWTDESEFKTEKRLSLSRDSPTHFDSKISKYSYEPTSSSSWLSEKSRRNDESSPTRTSFESRHDLFSTSSSHYSTHTSSVSISKPYSRYDYALTKSESKTSDKDISYFSSDSSVSRDSHSPSSVREPTSRPYDSLTFKSERSDVSSVDDYQQKLSYSPKRKYTDDHVYSFRPSVSSTVEFSSGTPEVTRRTSTREHTRPHSTIISDLTSMEVLNRSYSSSSIDGYLTRSRPDLTSISDSPERARSPVSSFKPILDDISDRSRSTLCRSPIYELDSPVKTSTSSHYRHLSPRRDEFDSRISSKDSSPPRYSSYSDSSWDKDSYSSLRKSTIDSKDSTSSSLSSKIGKSYSPPTSPTKSKDIHIALPPIKSSLGSPTRPKSKFDPFPPRLSTRQPKELGIKLGLYSTEVSSKNGKSSGKKT